MDFFFNELSVHDQFQTQVDFKAAVNQFRQYRRTVTNADFRMYIHRNILERPVLGRSFRRGIQTCFNQQQIRTLMNWLNKDGVFLPDDAYAEATDQFTCYFPEDSDEESRNITGSALAECAFRKMNDKETCSISLEQSEYDRSPIKVSLEQFGEIDVENEYTEQLLAQRVTSLLPTISSWPILLDRIQQLPGVTTEDYVLDSLSGNPFARNVAEGLYVCATALSEMATAPSLEQFNELYAKYATGGKARFSDSSTREKRDFKESLTFEVDGEQQLCPFHGKVKIQQYRIHLVKKPAFQNHARIVYIGPKLTKV
jgi:hypothetical protein